jgi:muconolactone delta-isomerase
MKFLTISTVKDTISMLPPAISRQLTEASVAWVNQQKKAGVILEIYTLAGWARTAVICEHESAEHLVQTIAGMPLAGFMNFEVYPLADFNQSMKAHIEAAKVAEQMFPAKK